MQPDTTHGPSAYPGGVIDPCDTAGLRAISAHAFATFLLDQGEELHTVMELLGHSKIRMTADTYGMSCRRGLIRLPQPLTGLSAGRRRRDRFAVPDTEIIQRKCWWSPGDSNP
ncbi:hypothetical protein M8C17_14465 [Micromonospora sp. RHAY321]|uniref:hypothetical protein n=1 Tax=Micromonospora sp. RHAY321 TaxID=2944807 RepID=UPI00207C9262|nr:hypothetical protein [Micromonospora sp. RHAY321]MCO1596361.1 hypothetical protein [Micromonospora sp. RHAY321]